jgi:L-seryl-tRNA(Ser) seleniumtransferase
MDGYSLVQMDVETGERCLREAHIQKILTELTGAEAATVVNNNAGATLLVLNTIARGRDVIVSRGQLVEIGGSFRIPDVMKQSGARLVEVGTTNRTHLRDYERAITEDTAALLHVHASNYRIMGFTKTVTIPELVELGKKHGLPVVDDLGSGALVDLARFGFSTEPLVRDSIEAGVDLVTFSADKLVGGPQGGIILGREKYVEAIRKSSLTRALRVGKLTLSALEMTLREFLDDENLARNHPIMRIFSITPETLKRRARRLAGAIERSVPGLVTAIEKGAGRIGSGSLPLEDVPTWLVAIRSMNIESGKLVLALRRGTPPVFARVQDDRVLFDLRTILDGKEEKAIVRSLETIMKEAVL